MRKGFMGIISLIMIFCLVLSGCGSAQAKDSGSEGTSEVTPAEEGTSEVDSDAQTTSEVGSDTQTTSEVGYMIR